MLRVKKILEIAENGSEWERKELLEYVKEMCTLLMNDEVPDKEGDYTWNGMKVSLKSFAMGTTAYPLLLIHLDDDASSMELLVKIYMRIQEAWRIRRNKPHPDSPEKSRYWARGLPHGKFIAHACRHFLDLYNFREDLKRKCTPEQLKALADFASPELAQKRADPWINELFIMEFAVPFVMAGKEGENN